MKQRISPAQLAELTAEQRERLREWWKPEINDIFWDYFYEREAVNRGFDMDALKKYCLPLLSIGQCIELLEDKGVKWYRKLFIVDCADGICKWYDGDFDNGELIDALFAAVKEVL